MKLFILCLSLLIAGGLCKIDDTCTVKPHSKGRSKPLIGTYQKRGACIASGRAVFSKSEPTIALGLSDDEDRSESSENEILQCCVEITCGDNGRCRNNVEGNPCTTGSYLPNLNRARNLCPSATSDDSVQCCHEKIEHSGLKIRKSLSPRSFEDDFDSPNPDFGYYSTLHSSASDLGETQSVGTAPAFAGGNMALNLPPALGSTVSTAPAPGGLGDLAPSFKIPEPIPNTAFNSPVPATDPVPAPVPDTITTTPAPATIPNESFNTPVNNAVSTFEQNTNPIVSAFHNPNVQAPGVPTGGGFQPIIAIDPKTRLLNLGFNTGNGLRATVSPLVPMSSILNGNSGGLGAGGMVNLGINFKP